MPVTGTSIQSKAMFLSGIYLLLGCFFQVKCKWEVLFAAKYVDGFEDDKFESVLEEFYSTLDSDQLFKTVHDEKDKAIVRIMFYLVLEHCIDTPKIFIAISSTKSRSNMQRSLQFIQMSPRLTIFSWDSPKFSQFRFFSMVGFTKFSKMSSRLIKINCYKYVCNIALIEQLLKITSDFLMISQRFFSGYSGFLYY